MAITQLPQSTSHLLGSAQALTTPTSLVKELIDNALDAKALSVDILIAPNTIDKIEVRDNGHGIQQEDLDALGRRGHTSKLRSFDELKSIGGVSLGFRGEALASAVQLGEVTVTTRTNGEAVATTVKLKALGGVDSQSRTSHPIGTTVSVTKFMYKMPVRKQTFLNEASKTLGKIRELLQAYALARPSVKFSFKVFKEHKTSWSYAPRPNDGIKEAVSQIIGKEAASQCILKSTRFPERVGVESTAEHGPNLQTSQNSPEPKSEDFIIDVFLPKRDADPSKIGCGQYISVDSRPVSHEKNTMRKIVTIFKYYMRESLSKPSEKTKSPFLRLNITCPVGSYDPNVEPAKNDVIFGNESHVLEAIENLFKEVYGEPKNLMSVTPPQLLKEKLDNFESLLIRKPAALPAKSSPSPTGSKSMVIQTPEAAASKDATVTSSTADEIARSEGSLVVDNLEIGKPVDRSKRKWVFDVSKDLSEDFEGFQRASHQSQQTHNTQTPDPEMEPDPRNSLNPWIIAKMTAPVQARCQLTNTAASYSVYQPATDAPQTPQHSSVPVISDPDIQFQGRPSRPRRTFRSNNMRSLIVPPVQNLFYQHPESGSIQRPDFQPTRRPSTADADDDVLLDGDGSGTRTRRSDFFSARNISDATLLSPPATLGQMKSRSMNRPFMPPMRNMENNASSHGLRQTKLVTDYGASRGHNRIHQKLAEQQSSSDLEWSMDFEHRKELATRRRRDELRAAISEVDGSDPGRVVHNSPHKNRYNAAIANLEAAHVSSSKIETAKEPFKTSLPDGDPRAYLMRRQKSIMAQRAKLGQAPKMTCAKANKLPLENIPEHEKTYNLALGLSADMSSLRRITAELMKSDMYMKGNEALGLRIGSLEITGVAGRVQAAVRKWMEKEGKESCEVEYKFGNSIIVD